jgi:hypothetical protein
MKEQLKFDSIIDQIMSLKVNGKDTSKLETKIDEMVNNLYSDSNMDLDQKN